MGLSEFLWDKVIGSALKDDPQKKGRWIGQWIADSSPRAVGPITDAVKLFGSGLDQQHNQSTLLEVAALLVCIVRRRAIDTLASNGANLLYEGVLDGLSRRLEATGRIRTDGGQLRKFIDIRWNGTYSACKSLKGTHPNPASLSEMDAESFAYAGGVRIATSVGVSDGQTGAGIALLLTEAIDTIVQSMRLDALLPTTGSAQHHEEISESSGSDQGPEPPEADIDHEWDNLTHAQLAALPNTGDARYAKGRWLGAAVSTHASTMLAAVIQYLTNEHGIHVTSDRRQMGMLQLSLNLSALVTVRLQHVMREEGSRDDVLSGFYEVMADSVTNSLGHAASDDEVDTYTNEVHENCNRTFAGCNGWKRDGRVEADTVAFVHGKSVAYALGAAEPTATARVIALLTTATEKELESLDMRTLFPSGSGATAAG